ncbi:DUF3887 domain-containing protein [Eggerthella lenta]|uniref:DUF3887 domain-containing protein n=1 Tax=Eggerthella lenta TaxID=84112 RepID=A0A5C5BRF3_EGGLN|nr:DUF3887 domain-containing protein [Eggerthella lenta]MDB1768921.1 DUF3887 domain-containing protein [Eggerthella lenta]MDU5351870.1 DUF3887 domain-containing protein [Eggerthella sp.]TNU88507.1 DUF3887 domain-containing protein [Eggerthella lenta]
MNKESYVKAVAKRLTCSKARQAEFVRDLESDIAAALSAGETWEQVESRMGDPRQVAQEFNEDLSEAERAAGKKRKRTKTIAIVATVAVAVAAIIGAAAWWAAPKYVAVGQASGHTEQEVLQQAELVVELFNSGDAEALSSLCDGTLGPLVNDELFDSVRAVFGGGDWGAFESFGNGYVGEFVYMGKTSNPVELVAVYENKTITFILAFNKDMELTGIQVK